MKASLTGGWQIAWYLVLAAAAVLLSWLAVCGLVDGSAGNLHLQRQKFDFLTTAGGSKGQVYP